MSFDLILPFLRPIAHLILDPDVTEIMVNGSRRVFVERAGQLQEVTGVELEPRHLKVAVKNIARVLGDDVSEAQPILDARLPDGSRVAAVVPPCSLGGTTLTIRKFQTRFFSAEELVRLGTMPHEVLTSLRRAIDQNRPSLLVGAPARAKRRSSTRSRPFCPPTTGSSSSKTRPSSSWRRRTWCALRPAGPTLTGRPSRSATCCAPRSAIARTESSSAKSAAPRRSTCCRPSIRATRGRCRRFTRTRRCRRSTDSRPACSRAAWSCRMFSVNYFGRFASIVLAGSDHVDRYQQH